MSLINLVIVLALVGFLLWLIVNFIPMPAPVQKIIIAVVVVFVVLWLLQGFGVITGFEKLRLR